MQQETIRLTTAQFAKLHNVNKRTLHYYDDIGLFSPCHKGENGYRYYDYSQSIDFEYIRMLKEINLSIEEIKDFVRDDQIIITIAPGKTLAWLEEQFGKKVKIVRTMPNTPAMVGEGMTAACPNKYVTEEELKHTVSILSAFGKVEVVPERLMDVVVSTSGSSPAYVFMFIEAMADAAVADGMPRAQAYKFAAQAVYGSAKMVLETGKHPGELKDMVCSPAGTTIEAVRVLERNGFRSAVIEAMKACTEISKNM